MVDDEDKPVYRDVAGLCEQRLMIKSKENIKLKIKNIQTKLLLILLPLFFTILAVMSGVSYYLSQQALTKSINATASAVGSDYANRLQSNIELNIAQLEDLASIQLIRTGADKAQIVEAMAEFQNRLGTYAVVVFASPDGLGVNTVGSTATYADRDYFKKVIVTKKPIVSDPLISKATGKMAVALAVPVTNNGQLTGVLIGTISMDNLTALIKDLKFLDTGYGQLADSGGLIIAHPKKPELQDKLNLREKKINPELKLQQTELDDRLVNLFKSAADSGKQVLGFYNFGEDQLAVFTPINFPGGKRWVMTVAAPVAEATRELDILARTMFVFCVVCLLITVVSIIFISRRFAKPIALIRDECLLLAQGDLREQTRNIFSEDEIGQLARGFRKMRTNLRELVTKVHSQSEQLAASSQQLSASAEQSAQAANQVAASITDVATGAAEQLVVANDTSVVVERISANIEEIAATTSEVAGQTAQAVSKANEGNKSVNTAVSQMVQVEQTVNTSAQVVAELGERSKEIGQIVDTISGIAGQTNLLALNAAIEAARAGDQGRGFAVVAEEVRKLAEQSQTAAQHIATLINSIQEDTDKAVLAMSQGTKEVKLGTEVVNAAGQAFQEIVFLVTKISDQVKEISVAIDQMASGSQQIVGSVNRIDDLSKKAVEEAQTVSAATEEQSASMEEIASSSHSLAQLAMDLQEVVSKFHV
jgi:methyl-accepting chemotaxis protein